MKKILLIFILLMPFLSEAATLRLNSSLGAEVGVSQIVPVEIRLDADGENLNAVELEVIYNKSFLRPVSFSDGGSIISLWVERPDLNSEKLVLKGVMPGGYNWNNGLLGKINFESLKPGRAALNFFSATTFLNDGFGTEVETVVRNLELKILSLEKKGVLEPEDGYPPEKFNPEVLRDTNIYDGQHILIFTTQDKQSGIDYYEIQETKNKKPEKNRWGRAASPYLLKDQVRESYIFVKAVDRKGNERIEKIYPISYKPWYRRPTTYIVVLLIILVAMRIKQLWQRFVI